MRSLSWPGTLTVVAGIAAALLPARARADTVILRNGRTLSGKIVAAGEEAVILEVVAGSGHGTIKIPRAEVASIHEGDWAPGDSPVGMAPPTRGAPRPLDSRSTADLEGRLDELGPSREALLRSLEPSPREADELATLERGLDAGTSKAADRLAARGRPALVVAARALGSPSRERRAAAARAVALLAKDERSRPYLVALDLPRLLIAAAGDEATAASPRARLAARGALAAIARREPGADAVAATERLDDGERLALGLLRDEWESEQKELAAAEEPRARERAEIEAELRRRGLAPASERPGRVEVRGVADDDCATLPEPALLLPRLVLHPPTALAVSGEGAGRALHFQVELENQGVGPLELRVSEVGRLNPSAVQRVLARYPGSERCVAERERTIAQLVPDARHGHRHLDRVLRFELVDETFAPAPGARGGECPVCLRDARRTGPGGPLAAVFAGAGGQQGISPGWTAVSDADQPGQSVALGAVEDGVYYLVAAVPLAFDEAGGPDDLLAAVKLRLEDGRVESLETLGGKALRARRAEPVKEKELH